MKRQQTLNRSKANLSAIQILDNIPFRLLDKNLKSPVKDLAVLELKSSLSMASGESD